MNRIFRIAAAFLVLCLLSGLFLFIAVLRWLYPLKYSHAIVAQGNANGIDPMLVAAVINVESRFRHDVVSPKGAMGLMQVMPETARWVASEVPVSPFYAELLLEPEVNITIGTWYLRFLVEEFDGNIDHALAAYNGGRTRVKRWLAECKDSTGVDWIPLKETREFVQKVKRNYRMYLLLYNLGRG
ncbi:MAG: lytic transglycosylase domain-containing protein [Bacillota bacterium]